MVCGEKLISGEVARKGKHGRWDELEDLLAQLLEVVDWSGRFYGGGTMSLKLTVAAGWERELRDCVRYCCVWLRKWIRLTKGRKNDSGSRIFSDFLKDKHEACCFGLNKIVRDFKNL